MRTFPPGLAVFALLSTATAQENTAPVSWLFLFTQEPPKVTSRPLSEADVFTLREFVAGEYPANYVLAFYIVKTDPNLGPRMNSLGMGGEALSIGFEPHVDVTPENLRLLGQRLEAVGIRYSFTVARNVGF